VFSSSQHPIRHRVERTPQGLRGAREHLEVHVPPGPEQRSDDETERYVEDVVARDPDVRHPRILAPGAEEQHALEVRVYEVLRAIGGLRPAARRGLAALHGQVRALYQTDPDGGAAPLHPLAGPGDEIPLHRVGVGEIRLEHDSGAGARELRLVQHAAEYVDGQLEVPMLFHVQGDELRDAAAVGANVGRSHRLAIQPPQTLRENREDVLPGQQLQLGGDRRDLDRDALDVGPGYGCESAQEARLGLLLAHDGLAELIEVDAHPEGAPSLQAALETTGLPRHDDAVRLAAHPREHQRNQEAGCCPTQVLEGAQLRAIQPPEIAGKTVKIDEMGDLISHPARIAGPRQLVRQCRREALPGWIAHEPGEPRLRPLVPAPRTRVGQPLQIGCEGRSLRGRVDGARRPALQGAEALANRLRAGRPVCHPLLQIDVPKPATYSEIGRTACRGATRLG
jgi:hypothetical protein